MLKVTCALIVDNGNLLLAQLGDDSAHPFQWEFPGGKIQDGESAETCVKREIKEELDILIEVVSALIPITHDYGFQKVQLIPFLCFVASGKIILYNHIDFKWVKLNQLSGFNLAEADKKLIEVEENKQKLKKYLGEKMDYS